MGNVDQNTGPGAIPCLKLIVEIFNAIQYIKELEEIGFVQFVLAVIEGTLTTKTDLYSLEQRIDHRFTQMEYRIVTKLGILVVATTTLAIALVSWIMRVG
jgi:hypothetical protein